jgi:hypothetical protein
MIEPKFASEGDPQARQQPKPMKLIELFTYYSAMDFDPAPSLPWRAGPWCWATNGHVLVGVRDVAAPAEQAPAKYQKAQLYLEPTLTDATTISLRALKEFAGKVTPALVECQDCLGSGRQYGDEFECEHCGQSTRTPCRCCGGDGESGIDVRYGRILGETLNLTLLAFGLSLVGDVDIVQIGRVDIVANKTPYKPICVMADDWRVAVMCCRDVHPKDMPVFQP